MAIGAAHGMHQTGVCISADVRLHAGIRQHEPLLQEMDAKHRLQAKSWLTGAAHGTT